jgi:hypothetical protein
LSTQTPFVLNAVWRTEGQQPRFQENAFDVFAWTDLGFLQLFLDVVSPEAALASGKITRPCRALIWLIDAIWDYTTQGTLDFGRIHSEITYGAQSDKAAAFTRNTLQHLMSSEFLSPRIKRDELEYILSPEAFELLMPERRLDAAIAIQHLINQQRAEETWPQE